MSRPPRRLSRAALAVAVALSVCVPVRAQNVGQYLALAREYADGRGTDADASLARWTKDNVTVAVTAALTTAGVHDLLAAAMLHTDLANTIVDTQPFDAEFHLTKARALLDAARERLTDHERVEAFTERWFRFVARMYGSCDLPSDAVRYVKLGLLVFPEDPHLYTTRGILMEVRLRAILADWRQGGDLALNRRSAEEVLKAAAMQFRHALSLASHDADARLHLGWGLFFLGDKRAKAELDAALADAASDTTRYLAHLFLGGLAEREHRLTDAVREYESARTIGAGYQTPYVALSRIEEALGHADRAREIALVALQLRKTGDDDPWWDHRVGFDRDSLTWLRAEVRKP